MEHLQEASEHGNLTRISTPTTLSIAQRHGASNPEHKRAQQTFHTTPSVLRLH